MTHSVETREVVLFEYIRGDKMRELEQRRLLSRETIKLWADRYDIPRRPWGYPKGLKRKRVLRGRA